jgi:hypothetical protein
VNCILKKSKKWRYIVDRELLLRIKAYMEKNEVIIDDEWGDSRTLEKIISDGDMPKLYKEVCDLLKI